MVSCDLTLCHCESLAHAVAVEVERLPQSEDSRKQVLKSAFTAFVTASDALVSEKVTALVNRLRREEENGALSPLNAIMLRLNSEYPGDRGIMAPLLLNYLQLGPGVAFVVQADEPHAYLSGDILECMACSDNVVRAALTPKFKDVPTLISMLTYE